MIDILNNLSGIEFENLCQNVLESLGFTTETTKATGDGGIDIIAHSKQVFFSGKYIIQCKRYSGSVGEPIIRDLYGVVTSERANKGILITTGYFTPSAIKFSEDKNIELIDGQKLCHIITQNNIEISNIQDSPEFILREKLQRTGLSVDEYQYYLGDEEEASNLIICKNELEKTNSNSLRAKAIAILYSRLDRVMFNENGINFDYSALAIQGCNCIEKYALPILSSKPKSDTEKRIKYNTMYIMCLCDIVRGNFADAIIRYAELLEDDDLAEHTWEYPDTNKHKLHLLRAICSLLRILGANELIEDYGTQYQEVVGEIIFNNFSIICDPDIGDPSVIPSIEKENDDISRLNFACDDAIIIPVESIGGGVNWLEDFVIYNIHKISYVDGKVIISGEFQMDIWDSSKKITTKIGFFVDSEKIESEKKRLELLL